MKKTFFIVGLFFLLLVVGFGLVVGDESDILELSEAAANVQTNNGLVNLAVGTILGDSSCTNCLYLEETRVFQTTAGAQSVASGTVINCDPPTPGVQDPCDPY